MSPRHHPGVRRSSRRTFLATVGLLAGVAWQGSAVATGDARESGPPGGERRPDAEAAPEPDAASATGPAPYPLTDWRMDLGGSMYHSAPVIDGGTAYLGVTTDNSPSGGEGYVAAYDARSGERAWKRDDLPAPEPPAVRDGRLHFATSVPDFADGGGLYALDADDGEPAWHRAEPHRWTDPVVTDDRVYAANRHGAHALDPATGRTVWTADGVGGLAKEFGNGALTRTDDTVFLADGTALDAADGSVRWSVDEPLPGDPTADGDRVYYTRTDYVSGDDSDVVVEARSPSDGSVLWTFGLENRNRWDGDVVVGGGKVFLVVARDDRSAVTALDAASGSVAWTRSTEAQLRSTPAVADGTVYAGGWYVPRTGRGSGRAVVYALDAETGAREWAYLLDSDGLETAPTNPPAANTPVVADGRLYTATHPALATLNHHYTYYSNFFALGSCTTPPEADDRVPADDALDGC